MRQRNCGGCGQPVYRNHHCRATAIADPPVPLDRESFDLLRQEARAEARSQQAADAQLLIPIDEDPDDECFCGDARSWHPGNRECLVCADSPRPWDGCGRFRFAGHAGWRAEPLLEPETSLTTHPSQNRGGRA